MMKPFVAPEGAVWSRQFESENISGGVTLSQRAPRLVFRLGSSRHNTPVALLGYAVFRFWPNVWDKNLQYLWFCCIDDKKREWKGHNIWVCCWFTIKYTRKWELAFMGKKRNNNVLIVTRRLQKDLSLSLYLSLSLTSDYLYTNCTNSVLWQANIVCN